MNKNSIWVIVPAFNEEQYILKVLSKVKEVTPNVLVVDDGSTDLTYRIITNSDVMCLRHSINLGKGAAMKTGCDYAFNKLSADAVVFIDSDDQHDIRELSTFFRELNDGNDVVLGYRKTREEMPRIRRLGNSFSSWLVNLFFGIKIKDIPCGYRGFTKKAYQVLRWESSGYEVETEIVVRLATSKLHYVEVPISTVYHDADKGFSFIDGIVVLIKLVHWRIALFF